MGTLSNTSVGLGGQALFSSSNRLIGLAGGLYTEPNYARHLVSRGGNDEILGFYGHRLMHRRDEDAARASFVSFVGAEVQQARLHSGNTREEEEEASAAVSHSNSGSLPLVRRGGGGNGQGKAIVAAPAVEQPWSVNILSRSKPSDGEQQQQQQNNEKEDNNNAVTVVDMELLNPRSVGEQQQQQQQQSQMMQLQQHRGMQVEPILMRQRSSSGATIACQDCGNQAKKDCPHMRCRTCCKSRGFDCATHIRSTWVPASKRRERQQAEVAAMVSGQPVPKSKRARTLALAGAAAHMAPQTASYTSTSTGTPPRSSDFNPALLPAHQQEAIFRAALPPEVKAQALFQCVRVTGVSDGQDEYAYKTVVRIGGRIFKGLLHDQGASDKGNAPAASVAELQLGGRSAPLSSALIDLAGIYGTPGNTLLGDLGGWITPSKGKRGHDQQQSCRSTMGV